MCWDFGAFYSNVDAENDSFVWILIDLEWIPSRNLSDFGIEMMFLKLFVGRNKIILSIENKTNFTFGAGAQKQNHLYKSMEKLTKKQNISKPQPETII